MAVALFKSELTVQRFLLSLLLVVVFVPLSLAQAPDVLRYYHLLPRFSQVHETGGFAGLNNVYRARGEFDFLRHWDHGTFSAQFDDAEIWGTPISDGPVIAVVLDVDHVLNLEGLRGELLPTLNPFANVYQFKGESPDSSFVNLFAYQRGPWLYLRGSTNPPPDVADFIEYDIHALARTGPWADMNDDGRVDAADYTYLRDHQGSDMGGLTLADWRQQFGEAAPDMATMETELFATISSAGVAASQVPEPATVGLAILVGALRLMARCTWPIATH